MPAMEKDGESEREDHDRRESRVDVNQLHDVLLGRVNGGSQTIEMKPIDHGVNSLDEKAKAIGGVTGRILLEGDRLRGSASEKCAERQSEREDDRGEEHVNDLQRHAEGVCLNEIDIQCEKKNETKDTTTTTTTEDISVCSCHTCSW